MFWMLILYQIQDLQVFSPFHFLMVSFAIEKLLV